jgi:hypothetical protein
MQVNASTRANNPATAPIFCFVTFLKTTFFLSNLMAVAALRICAPSQNTSKSVNLKT